MPEVTTPLYEGMFLFNIQKINGDLDVAMEQMNEIFSRAEAEIVALGRWDERKLAYEIEGQKRGLYILAYFKVRGAQIANIERDVNLSETIMRCLILRADHMGEIEIEHAIAAAAKSKDHAALAASPADDEAAESQVDDASDVEAEDDDLDVDIDVVADDLDAK